MTAYQDVLRHLAVNDRGLLPWLTHPEVPFASACRLDAKTAALVRVASLVSGGGPVETFRWTIGDAVDAGATPDEVVGVILAVAPLVGVARAAATAPKVALALDYDLDAALETREA